MRRYKITSSLGVRYVTPLNDSSIVYKWVKIKDSINYKLELSTKLIFSNNSKTNIFDFDFLYSFESNESIRCEDLNIEIYNVCNGIDKLEYKGILQLITGEWDLDKCTVKLNIINNQDIYSCILKNKKETLFPISYDMPHIDHAPDNSPSYSVSDYDVDMGAYYFGTYNGIFGLWDTATSSYTPIYSIGIVVYVASVTHYWTTIGDGRWVITHTYTSDFSGYSHYLYDEKVLGLFNFPYTKKLKTQSGLFFNDRMRPDDEYSFQLPFQKFNVICTRIVSELLSSCGGASTLDCLTSDFFDWNAIGDTIGYIPSTITKLPLNLPTINYPTGEYGSRFLFTPITPGINYLTGQSNHLTNMMFVPKSNYNNVYATEWEQPYIFNGTDILTSSNKLTFEDIESIWANVFDCYWFIDTDGRMRVEHSTWFNNTATTYDSTSIENAKFNIANKKYNYKTELLPKKEVFKFLNNRDYVNGKVDSYANKYNEILYDSICVNQTEDNNESLIEVKKVITDMAGINSIYDSTLSNLYDKVGIFLCTVNFNTSTFVTKNFSNDYYNSIVEAQIDTEQILLSSDVNYYENAHLQWGNLIRRYLKNGRVLTVGKNQNDLINFTARTRKSKIQSNVFLKSCCSMFNPKQALIITELGTGEVEEAEFDTKTNLIKLKVAHD